MRIRPALLFVVFCRAAFLAGGRCSSPNDRYAGRSYIYAQPVPTSRQHPLSGLRQANIIFQAHGPFHSPYEGINSLLGRGEYTASLLGTVYLGYEVNNYPRYATDAILDVESAGGRGISEALGLAGFTNLDVVRNPNLGPAPYLSQYIVH